MSHSSELEIKTLEIFKSKIEDLLPEIEEFLAKDIHLLRWLRARNFNVDKAEAMIRKSMAWRRENNIDSVLTWTFPDIIVRELPWRCCGYDRDGCPVVIIPFGKWNIRKVIESGFKTEFLQGGYFCNEWEIVLMKHQSNDDRTIHQAVQIIDLEGYSFTQFVSKQTIDAFAEQIQSMEDNYPEILKTIYIINAPRIFTLLFALIKPLLSAETLSKVNIFDSNSAIWKKALLENIDPENLPSQYGGANTNCENFDDMMKPTLDAGLIQPKFINFNESEFIQVTVDAGSRFKADFEVQTGFFMSWAFKTENDGIGFAITNELSESLVDCGLIDSHMHTQKGTLKINQSGGKVTFVFDNKLDRRNPRKLSYVVSMKNSPKELE